MCKIIGIQSEIIKRQSEALEVVNAYDVETDRLMEELEKNENILVIKSEVWRTPESE